jgi:K(+)-stimulated pyrophosphate-energized sodium pump
MSNETKGGTSGLHWPVAIVLALILAFMWFKGYGPFCEGCKSKVEAATKTDAVSEAISVNAIVLPKGPDLVSAENSVVAAEIPSAKIYFGSGATAAPNSTTETLAQVVAFLKANPDAKAQVSGFHDPTGNQATNEEIAKKRAEAVTAALANLGITSERVVMNKPQVTTGTGSNAEARRVEVSVAN